MKRTEHFDEHTLRTWLNENAEAYSKFKNDLEEMLRESLWTTLSTLDESDVEAIEDCLPQIIALLQEEELTLEDLYAEATENDNTTAYCLCCYLHFEDGLNKIKRAMEQKIQQAETQEIIKGIEGFVRHHEQESKSESDAADNKELNLLTLRRWHYNHPKEYAEFLESLNRAYEGDTDFVDYRTFHYAMLEKFPKHKISKGFDHAEALYHAIVKKSTDDYNASITQAQIDYGKKMANDISLQFRLLLSPDIK